MRPSLQSLVLLLAAVDSIAISPPVKVTLRSSWSAPPSLVEVLETVALENPDAFFPLLDHATDPNFLSSPENMSPGAVYQAVLQAATVDGLLTEPGSVTAVEMNLALHAATPKIQAFYNYYEDNNSNRRVECGSWVDWYGEVVCDVESLAKFVGTEARDPAVKASNSTSPLIPKLLKFDHIFPSPSRILQRPPRTAILYATPSSPNFRELHSYLFSFAGKPEPSVEYVLRHIPPKTRDGGGRNPLSGYGVALNLKKMDYLAVDDRNHREKGTSKASTSGREGSRVIIDPILDLMDGFPDSATTSSSNTPLTALEIEDISWKAIQLITNSTSPLATLTRLSQNFPKYTTPLARRVIVNANLESEIRANSLKAQPGARAFWLNGANVPDKDINPIGLLRLLRKERATMLALTGLGMTRAQSVEVLTHASVAEAQGRSDVLDGLFDASDRTEGGGVIIWWNDMEKDSRYARWSPSLYTLLRPSFGSLPNIKLNLFNFVLVLDLSQRNSLDFMAGPMANIINNNIPLRFGVVPIVETENGRKMARLFYHLVRQYGRKRTLLFFQQATVLQSLDQSEIDWNIIQAHYDELVKGDEDSGDQNIPKFDDILVGHEQSGSESLDKSKAYTERLGAGLSTAPKGHAFLNGRHFDFDDNVIRVMQMELGKQMQYLQEKVFEGKVSDEHGQTMSTYFFDLPATASRRNRYIYPPDTPGNLRIYSLPDLFARTGFRITATSFAYPPETAVIPMSFYVVADLDSEAGLHLVKEALSSISANSRTRITFLHNPLNNPTEIMKRPVASWILSHLITSDLLSKVSPELILRALRPAATAGDGMHTQTTLSQDEALRSLTGSVEDFDLGHYTRYVNACQLVAREIGVLPGERVIIANGRVVGPLAAGDFHAADFRVLETYEVQKRAEPVVNALESVVGSIDEKDRDSYANLVSMATSVMSAIQQADPSEIGLFDRPPRPRTRTYQLLESDYTMFETGDNSTALYHIVALMDPLSETAQRWSSLLQWLSHIPDTFLRIHLNPAPRTEVPLKSFYRYNLLPRLSFDENGQEVPAQAIFEDLPVEPIYTLAMDVPSSWLVRPREALYDLDNLQLGSLLPGDTSVDAIFDLDYLVIEGHAREVATNNPPRGVQLELVQGNSTPVDDTQVVANLGYLQFKAKPGVFGLEIRKGRGRDIFKMDSVGNEGWGSKTVEEVGKEVTLTSFEGVTLYPRLAKLKGMENVDVLEEPTVEKTIFEDIASRVISLFQTKRVATEGQQAEINIFTVASGLLYERFASIMILSVLRNTKSTVKFWFIENFLSPSFLEFIPHMAEKYDFKYELVTYKWPSWLREQTEKQRIIWAYKILFLDVLFPMDLKKVIFVDADQIVRADLKELVDLDLHGAPYGYTPMGDDNEDMEGFRFWKTGYWKDFLEGRPYHISALYVIDLVRFRQLAAGDILRGQYQALSADPNSLANLDQDLPNNLQREVPIYSLHEDWLWCETWCSKDRLHRAKTIDLCQNPLTKEPKLSRARQIPEWEEYDAEIARFTRKLAEDGLIHSGMAAADTNVLANAGAVPVSATAPTATGEGSVTESEDRSAPEASEGVHEQVKDEL